MFDSILNFASMGVAAWGAVLAILGIIDFSEGHSQSNQAKKSDGMGKIIGGGVIIAVGTVLVPQLSSYLTF